MERDWARVSSHLRPRLGGSGWGRIFSRQPREGVQCVKGKVRKEEKGEGKGRDGGQRGTEEEREEIKGE